MGRTFYRLDKNWKRSDTTYQLGDLRTIGQGPCDDVSADEEWEEQGLRGCSKNQTDGTVTTMLHKGNMMYFVSWKNDTVIEPGETDATKVEDCSSMNLQVVGNIRPDWCVTFYVSLMMSFINYRKPTASVRNTGSLMHVAMIRMFSI